MFIEFLIIIAAFVIALNARAKVKRLEDRVESLEENIYSLMDEADHMAGFHSVSPLVSESVKNKKDAQNEAPLDTPQDELVAKQSSVAALSKPIEPKPTSNENESRKIAHIVSAAKNSNIDDARLTQSTEPVERNAPEDAIISDAITPEATIAETGNNENTQSSDSKENILRNTEPSVENIEGDATIENDNRIESIAAEASEKARAISFKFEDLFGRRLPIWAGGITLAIAGVFIVKYAIDAGFFGQIFTPGVQVIFGLLFGGGLIGGAEFAYRNDEKVQDSRIAQALSGAGIATLYTAILVASNIYGLIPPLIAFIGFAATTAGALGLSIRFGVPTALLGLAGGLAAPALTGGLETNVSLLAVYLSLTIAGMAGVSRIQRWPLLGIAALIGGAGWSLWMIIASNALDTLASLSVGGFVMLMAIGLPMIIMRGPRAALMRSAAAIVGAAQLAMLVALGGFEPLHFGLFILLAAAGQWLNWREQGYGIIPSISLGVSVMLLAIWPDAPLYWFAMIGGALAIIHAIPLFLSLWREPAKVQRSIELGIIALAIPLISAVQYLRFESPDYRMSFLSLFGALIMAAALWRGWSVKERNKDARFAWSASTMTVLIAMASFFALSSWAWPIALAFIAGAYLIFGEQAKDGRIERVAGAFAGLSLLVLMFTPDAIAIEFDKLWFGNAMSIDIYAILRWGGLLLISAIFSYRAQNQILRTSAYTVSGLLAYGLLAQMLPFWSLPIAMALVSAVMLLIKLGIKEKAQDDISAIFGVSALLLLLGTRTPAEIYNLFGDLIAIDFHSILRWGALVALSILFAIRLRAGRFNKLAQIISAALSYGLFAQMISTPLLPLVPAIAFLGLAYGMKRLKQGGSHLSIETAMLTYFAISALWSVQMIAIWMSAALPSVAGVPFIVDTDFMDVALIFTALLLPATLMLVSLWILRDQISPIASKIITISASLMAVIAIHSLYRMGFAQIWGEDFVQWGILQRLIWGGLLLGGAALLYRQSQDKLMLYAAGLMAFIAATHAIWFSLFLHNPLWSAQMTGSLPIFNLIIPIYALPAMAIYLLRKILSDYGMQTDRSDRAWEILKMILILCVSWTLLRQIFHAPLLIEAGVADAENISRSILAIALAVGYLLWGIRTQLRDWRIMSLILILLAVCKVFLLDTSGLDGLLRIASFIALGFSLMGIGWLYSRQLGRDAIANKDAVDGVNAAAQEQDTNKAQQ